MIEGEKVDKNGKKSVRPEMNEWDCYNEAVVGNDYSIPFFLYTIELTYAMLNAIEENEPIDMWKCKLYGIDYRPIMSYEFAPDFEKAIKKINLAAWRTADPNHSFGDRFALVEFLDLWKIKQ
jgi:hypothetical protein